MIIITVVIICGSYGNSCFLFKIKKKAIFFNIRCSADVKILIKLITYLCLT